LTVPRKPRCHYCHRPAELLCDYPVRERPRADYRACDRPLCAGHAHRRGTVFFCGAAGWTRSVDYCPDHAGPGRPVGGGSAA
jgi:hypothetical protein